MNILHLFMAEETGYHKLKNPSDASSVIDGTFNPSTPPEKHWLGEGAYFFLDPNGLYWATEWPFDKSAKRSQNGIIVAQIETENTLDLRLQETMKMLRSLINTMRAVIVRKYGKYTDGAALDVLFKSNKLQKPTGVIADFDKKYHGFLYTDSRILQKPLFTPPPTSKTTQIQACVIDQSIIKKKELYSNITAV